MVYCHSITACIRNWIRYAYDYSILKLIPDGNSYYEHYVYTKYGAKMIISNITTMLYIPNHTIIVYLCIFLLTVIPVMLLYIYSL